MVSGLQLTNMELFSQGVVKLLGSKKIRFAIDTKRTRSSKDVRFITWPSFVRAIPPSERTVNSTSPQNEQAQKHSRKPQLLSHNG